MYRVMAKSCATEDATDIAGGVCEGEGDAAACATAAARRRSCCCWCCCCCCCCCCAAAACTKAWMKAGLFWAAMEASWAVVCAAVETAVCGGSAPGGAAWEGSPARFSGELEAVAEATRSATEAGR